MAKQSVETMLALMDLYEPLPKASPETPQSAVRSEFETFMESFAESFDAFLPLLAAPEWECKGSDKPGVLCTMQPVFGAQAVELRRAREAKEATEAKQRRERKAAWLATGDLWACATYSNRCAGMGDSYAELAIRTTRGYNQGEFPPVFADAENAFKWAKAHRSPGYEYTVVPLMGGE